MDPDLGSGAGRGLGSWACTGSWAVQLAPDNLFPLASTLASLQLTWKRQIKYPFVSASSGFFLITSTTGENCSTKSSINKITGPDPKDLPKNAISRFFSSSLKSSCDVVSLPADKFSGSVVFTPSPPPSSLSLPTFSLRPKLSCKAEAAAAGSGVDAGATDSLRRLLRLWRRIGTLVPLSFEESITQNLRITSERNSESIAQNRDSLSLLITNSDYEFRIQIQKELVAELRIQFQTLEGNLEEISTSRRNYNNKVFSFLFIIK
ncbi:hypothetical protein LXL04_012816 [Taraxacum kok-saghyz]